MPGKFYPPPIFPQSNLRRRADSRWALPHISNFVYKLSLNYHSFKAVADCPPDSSSSRMAHLHTTPRSAQNWLRASCPNIITKDQWPPNLLNINSVDHHVRGAMWRLTASLKQSRKQSLNSRKCFRLSEATCDKDQLTRL